MLALIITVAISGCSLFSPAPDSRYTELAGDSDAATTSGATPVRIEPARIGPGGAGDQSGSGSRFIEVLWEVPSQPVQGYTIRYGTDEHDLSQTIRIESDKLQRVRGGNQELYRYLIPNPPTDKTVYVTLAAFDPSGESAPTSAFAVPPQETPAPASATTEQP